MAIDKKEKAVRVYLRVRPPVGRELARKDALDAISISVDDPRHCTIAPPSSRRRMQSPPMGSESKSSLDDSSSPDAEKKAFMFHHCFDQDSKQDDVYEMVARDAIDDVFAGYHGLIFVYGQTGTGKTYTLCCTDEGNEGILYNSVVEVFSRIEQDKDHDYECSLQFVQIYNEVIMDLLSHKQANGRDSCVVHMRDDPEIEGAVYLPGCTTVGVSSANECLQHYLLGDKRRAVAETQMNCTSSRSHTVFQLDVHRRPRVTKEDVENRSAKAGDVTMGRLILVDLAGSEKVKKTLSEGMRLTEAASINTSLLVLGKVINALIDDKQTHVPYRESKLTRLLQYPLSGMGKTSIVVTVSPSQYNYDETLSAIQFGQRAMKLKAHAVVHQRVDWKALALKLQAMVEEGMDHVRMETMQEQCRDYEKRIEEYKEKVEVLESRVRSEGGGGGAGTGKENGELNPSVEAITEENHALRELVRALQSKLIQLDDKRKEEKKQRKILQQTLDNEQTEKLRTEVRMTELSNNCTDVENQLLASRNKALALAHEVRRLHKQCIKRGLVGSSPAILALLTESTSGGLNTSTLSAKSVTSEDARSAPTTGNAPIEEEDGTLETIGRPSQLYRSLNEDEVSAYGDTTEQLIRAIQELTVVNQERQRLDNELRITQASHAKLLTRLHETEEQLRLRNRENEALARQLQEASTSSSWGGATNSSVNDSMGSLAETTSGVSSMKEQDRIRLMVETMREYESRMDQYKSQAQQATNEAKIEANVNAKLKVRLEHLENQIADLTQRQNFRHSFGSPSKQ